MAKRFLDFIKIQLYIVSQPSRAKVNVDLLINLHVFDCVDFWRFFHDVFPIQTI